jgi:hypothetical protein
MAAQPSQAIVSTASRPTIKMQLATQMTAERRARRRDVLNQRTAQLDADDGLLKNQQESGTTVGVPALYMGKNKSGKMVNFIFGDFASLRHLVSGGEVITHDLRTGEPLERAYIDLIVDCRSAAQHAKDKIANFKMEDATVYVADEVKARDNTDGSIRRVAFRFYSSRSVSMLDKAKIDDGIPQGTFMLINMIPSVWTEKETGRLAVMLKVTSTPASHPMPRDEFVMACFRSGSFTRKLTTRAFEFSEQMNVLSKTYGSPDAIEEKEKANARYRNDNEIVLALGFSHGEYRELRLDMADGIIYNDTTEAKDANFFAKSKDNKDINELRYTAELTSEQWEHDPSELDEETGQPELGYPIDHPERIIKVFVKLTFWKEQVAKLLINSATVWAAIAPVNMPYLKALIFAREDADVSFKNSLTQARMAEAAAKEESLFGRSAYLNGPAGRNKASFTLGLSVGAYVIPEVDWVQTVGFRVSKEAVIKILWNGTKPRLEGDVQGASKTTFEAGAMLNFSEVKVDAMRLLNTAGLELRIVTNMYSQEAAWSQDLFGQVKAAEGDQLLSYFVNKIQNKSELSLDQYAANNRWTLSPQHYLKRFNFVHTGSKPVFQVFGISTQRLQEEQDMFRDFLANLKSRSISGAISGGPGTLALPAPPPSVSVTSVPDAASSDGDGREPAMKRHAVKNHFDAARARDPKSPERASKTPRTQIELATPLTPLDPGTPQTPLEPGTPQTPLETETLEPHRSLLSMLKSTAAFPMAPPPPRPRQLPLPPPPSLHATGEEEAVDRMEVDQPPSSSGALAEADGDEEEQQQPTASAVAAARSPPPAITSLLGQQGAADEPDFTD